ncbi:hypothetical protein Pan97_19230 [Bremerella volcania]|uniref:Uncharacterized protein n=1 Tax=Bremerella volcania TaxID=2527984 RepID=A0A518C6Q0_9BACT|nr:hypothetical protein [Bremerella volcania]QDU74903.1 hypothetical protein Pan97_19230 [Bremerella volcania]
MSVGPMGASIASSIAATNLAQRNSSDVSGAQQATSTHARVVESTEKAEKAAGVGDPEESEKTSDRDADGRRAWERPGHDSDEVEGELEGEATYDAGPQKDPTGVKGREIDLSG